MSNLSQIALILALSCALLSPAFADDAEDGFTPLPPAEAKSALDAVQKDWHARSGETALQMVASLRTNIGFKPFRWYADTRKEDGKKVVSLTWTRKPGETEADHVGVVWTITDQGPKLEENDRLFGLGSAAFALNQVQQDVDNEVPGANAKYLHDPKNLNFVDTPNGKLGDILSAAGCKLGEPLYVIEVASGFVDPDSGFIRFQATVDCSIKSTNVDDAYTYKGALIALKLVDGAKDWMPTSFLAARIWAAKPGHWSEVTVPIENQVFEAAKNSAKMAGSPSFDWLNVARCIELRNSGRPLPDSAEGMHAFETAGLLLRIQSSTNELVKPASVETFLRHAGLVATTLSDQGVVDSIPMFFAPR